MNNQPQADASKWTILKILKWTTSYFQTYNIKSPRASAEILLAHVLKSDRIDLYVRYDQPLSRKELEIFKSLIKRRAIQKEPVAYIVGVKGFRTMDIAVTKDVLIPRPETEHLVEAALDVLEAGTETESGDSPKRVLELGTGSGAIICALASQCQGNIFIASDRSTKAVQIAAENAETYNLKRKIHFFSGDWFLPLKNNIFLFDIIISNPPYIKTGDLSSLQPEIFLNEPIAALDGGEDGLGPLKHIIRNAFSVLKAGGCLLLETGSDQKEDVQKIVDSSGAYEKIEFIKDYSGRFRVARLFI
jgi:release factor glutamine methyltransferase